MSPIVIIIEAMNCKFHKITQFKIIGGILL